MSVEVISQRSVDVISRLIRNEFDRYPHQWQFNERHELLKTARDFGLDNVANDMERDL